MIFFKQNIATEKRLSIVCGYVFKVEKILRTSVSSPQPEVLWQDRKEKKRLFHFLPSLLSFWFSYCQTRHCNLANPFCGREWLPMKWWSHHPWRSSKNM